MATENIIIQIREDGSRVVSRNLEQIGTASRSSQSAVDDLKSTLRGLAGALAINEIRKYADIWTQVRGKVNIFTHSADETAQVMERLFKIAQDTRQPIEGVGNAFHQLSIAGSALGASQEQLLTFTQAVGNALAVQGTDANTARGGILQLGQAMNEGIVRAQEYNSMINAMPIVLKTVANNLEGVGGSLAKLRQRMLEGKLYSKDFFDALLKGAPELAALFDKSGKTIGQSLTILRNGFIRYVGQVDEAYGVSQKFYELARFGADNIDHIARALIAVAAPSIVKGLWGVVGAMRAMAVAAIANPYTTLAAAIVATVTAAALYRDEIILIEKEQVSLGDYGRAAWGVITEYAGIAVDYIAENFPRALEKAMGNIIGIQIAFDDVTAFIRKCVNLWIGLFVALPQLFVNVWKNVPGLIYNIFNSMFNSLKGQAADLINGFGDALNPLMEKFNLGKIASVSFEQTKPMIVQSWTQMATEMGDIIKTSAGTDYIGLAGDALDKLTERAKLAAKARHEAEKKNIIDLSAGGGDGESFAGKNKGADKATKAAAKERERFLKDMQTESQAIEAEYAKRNEMIIKYTTAGTDERLRLQRRSDEMYANDQRDLLQKMTGAVESESEKLKQIYAKRTQLILENTEAGSKAQLDMLAKLKVQQQKDEAEIEASKQGRIDALSKDLLTEEQTIIQSYQRRNQAIMQSLDLSEQQKTEFLARSEAVRNEELLKINGTFWEKYLIAAKENLTSFNDLAETVTNNFSSKFGAAVEAMVFDSQTLSEAVATMAEGMLRSVVSALGEMAAQWLAYKLVQLLVGKTTQASAIIPMVANAQAMSLTAGINAFASTAAIPIVGPALAPAAATAAIAATSPMVAAVAGAATSGLAGMAHSGIDNIPKEGTWLLDKGERVVDSRTNADLKGYLSDRNSGSGPSNVVNIGVIIHNNASDKVNVSTESSQDDEGDPQLEVYIDHIEDALAARVGSGRGSLNTSISQSFNVSRKARNS